MTLRQRKRKASEKPNPLISLETQTELIPSISQTTNPPEIPPEQFPPLIPSPTTITETQLPPAGLLTIL
jgi:hypothetical protein